MIYGCRSGRHDDLAISWAMLAVANNRAANMNEYNRCLAEAERLPAVTPEDYLFRGQAESILDPERALG